MTIQWDEKKKKWVDVNADEDESDAAPAAPPTDRELHSSVPQSADPQGGGSTQGPPGPPASGDNKFRRPAKRNYVDVFQGNAKPATLSSAQPPSNLFQTLPTGPPATNMNFFVPGAVADDTTDSNQQPQFFNPNTFGSSANSNANASTDQQQYQQNQYQQQQQQQQQQQPPSMYQVGNTQPTQSQQEENNTQDEPPAQPSQPQQPPTQPAGPMFFNPQNMPTMPPSGPAMPPSGPARGVAGSTKRGYGARRQYPTAR
ncbi:probable serine/threonine-protein kinase samkC [Patiria miniata]|uniref:Uncharacterized protein n=1 Tax=Patiria miniata TaxID=46514 RepID=A0A913Z4F3_PATMI|nr:probable serine/threonine-protein kinase samkC [Patiria miniata]